MLNTNFSQIYQVVQQEKLIFVVELFLTKAAIFDSQAAWILLFWSPAALSCCMWNLRIMGAVVLENKSCEWT